MDELDLLLDSLELETPKGASEPADRELEADLELALEEFSGATNPKDRLEALRLLVRYMR